MMNRISMSSERSRQAAGSRTARVAIPIYGLSLGGCGAEQVERALRLVPGVVDVYVNHATEFAYVTVESDEVDLVALRRRVESVGVRTGPHETWRSLR